WQLEFFSAACCHLPSAWCCIRSRGAPRNSIIKSRCWAMNCAPNTRGKDHDQPCTKKRTTGCQPVVESAKELENRATTSAGWQPAVHFLFNASGQDALLPHSKSTMRFSNFLNRPQTLCVSLLLLSVLWPS